MSEFLALVIGVVVGVVVVVGLVNILLLLAATVANELERRSTCRANRDIYKLG